MFTRAARGLPPPASRGPSSQGTVSQSDTSQRTTHRATNTFVNFVSRSDTSQFTTHRCNTIANFLNDCTTQFLADKPNDAASTGALRAFGRCLAGSAAGDGGIATGM